MPTRLLVAAAALWGAVAAGAAPPPTIDDAQQAYHRGQYGRSLKLFEQLAAKHNAEAAECAGFMWLMGETMYGPQVRRDVERAKVLLIEAASAGRPSAGFLLNMIERTD